MTKLRLILKEFIFVPLFLLVLILLFSKLTGFFNLIPNINIFNANIGYFGGCKLLYSSVLVLLLLEIFLMFDVPDNIVFSRLVSVVVMLVSFFLLTYYISSVNSIYWLLTSIILGSVVNVLLETFVKFRYSNLIGTIIMILMTISMFILNYYKFI